MGKLMSPKTTLTLMKIFKDLELFLIKKQCFNFYNQSLAPLAPSL